MQIAPILNEFRASAIPDRLTLANVRWVEGDEAVEILTEHAIAQAQRVTSYVTEPVRRIFKRYQFARDGGWISYGQMIDGSIGGIALFKPDRPRPDFEKIGKFVKYETPQGCEALPILPCVTWFDGLAIARKFNLEQEYEQRFLQESGVSEETAQTGEIQSLHQFESNSPRTERSNEAAVSRRDRPSSGVDRLFWKWWLGKNLPIGVTEGLKKALSLIAHGMPAIAIRGITQWHKKGSSDLHPAIADFATPKRQIYIVFDEDEKSSTQRDVRREALKLGAALEQCGCKVSVPTWERSLGKGIDDVLFGQGESAQSWLDVAIADAQSLNAYKRDDRKRQARELIASLNRLSYPVERATEGEYLPELPQLEQGKIHAIVANQGAGKSLRIGKDWVKWAIAAGWNVMVLAPQNSLGEQSAYDWGLPHIHSYNTDADSQAALWANVSHSHGVVMCPDSLHRIPEWFWQRPVLLVLDESNQVIDHLCQGDTLKSRWAEINERFTEAARHAIATGAIVLAEDGLPDRAVNFIKIVSGAKDNQIRTFLHRKQSASWDVVAYRGQASGFRAQFLDQVQTGSSPLLYVSTSQLDAERMEKAIAKRAPHLKVVRIDSKTNQSGRFTQFFEKPSTWLETNRPDVLIFSPSAKSGISIQGGVSVEDAYFSEVWGYFPVLGTDTQSQLLGRFRPAVQRVVFCPDFILSSGDESLLYPRAIARRLQSNAKQLAGVYDCGELLEAEGDRAELVATIETAVMQYLSQSIAVSGAQKSIAHDALVDRLEAAGHTVRSEQIRKDDDAIALWKQIDEELWREQAAASATATVTDRHTPEWARATLDSLDASLEARILAQKVLWRKEFPGVTFDCPEECYQALCRDYGAMARGVKLQAHAENLDAAKEDDRAAVEAILKGNIRAIHRLPKGYVKSLLIARTGVLDLLDGGNYHNQDPRAIAVKAASVRFAREISYWLRLQINDTQTPVEICNKLLRKLGLEGVAVARPGARGQQNDRHYAIDGLDNPVRMRLLEALRCKLSGSVSTICNKEQLPYIQIVDTKAQSPPNQGFEAGDRKELPRPQPPPEPEPIESITEANGFQVGDRVGFGIDHFDKSIQRDIMRHNEVPYLKKTGRITGLYVDRTGFERGWPASTHAIVEIDGASCEVPASYLRRSEALTA